MADCFADDGLIRYYPAREAFDGPNVQWTNKSNAIVLLYGRAWRSRESLQISF